MSYPPPNFWLPATVKVMKLRRSVLCAKICELKKKKALKPHGTTIRVAQSWNRWKHVSSHFKMLAATFGCDSFKWLWLSQIDGTQLNGWDSAKWLGLSQMAGTQPSGCKLAKWLGLSQMAKTRAKWLGLSRIAGIQPNGLDTAKWLRLSQLAVKNQS